MLFIFSGHGANLRNDAPPLYLKFMNLRMMVKCLGDVEKYS